MGWLLRGTSTIIFAIDKEAVSAKVERAQEGQADAGFDHSWEERSGTGGWVAQVLASFNVCTCPAETCWPHGYAETACEGLAIEKGKPCNFIIDGGLATER